MSWVQQSSRVQLPCHCSWKLEPKGRGGQLEFHEQRSVGHISGVGQSDGMMQKKKLEGIEG